MDEKISDIKTIQKMVADRKDKEEQQSALRFQDEYGEDLSSSFIRECLNASEMGDGILYQAVNRGRVVFNKQSGRWLVWKGHHWQEDIMGQAAADVERVCEAYLIELRRIQTEINQLEENGETVKAYLIALKKSLIGRIKSLRSLGRLKNCLEFAHTASPPLAIT